MNMSGFTYIPDFLSENEEKEILHQLMQLNWQKVEMYGVIAKRQVIHYGLSYSFNTRTVTPTAPPPPFVVPLIERSATILNIRSHEIVETLLTAYPIGAGIGWHKDAIIFGDKIFGISLGNDCMMKFRKKLEEKKYEVIKTILKSRSAYILSEDARWKWQHSIPPVKQLRYSITFRTNK